MTFPVALKHNLRLRPPALCIYTISQTQKPVTVMIFCSSPAAASTLASYRYTGRIQK